MKVYRSIKDIKRIPQKSVVAVGIFDGIHKGHIYIIRTLIKRAKALKAKSLILTFYPHPSSVLHLKRSVPLLISVKHRVRLLEDLGVDIVMLVKFSKRFSKIKPETFVRDLLKERLGMKEMLVGGNFIFGKEGRGNIKLLKELAKKYNFKIKKVALLKTRNRIISSTNIRSLIIKGRLNEASRLLGRSVSILGTVRRGTKRGRFLGFPTANVDPHHEAIPPSGVYAVYVELDNKRYKGILNIGYRPTFHLKGYPPEPTVEVHLFDFNRNIYGKDLEILFARRLRPERRFKDREGLRRRIMLDERAARKILS